MQIGVDGQLQIRPGLTFAPLKFAHHPTGGVHLDMFGASRAAQQAFGAGLNVDFANLETRNAQHLIRVFQRIEIGLAYPAHAAHHMRKICAARVDAG